MIDVVVAIAIALVTVGIAYMGVRVALHPAESEQARKRYKYAFWFFALFAIVLIGWQAYRTEKYQDRSSTAIDKQGKRIESLTEDIRQRDEELANLNRQQLDVSQKELALKYQPSVDVVYEKKRLKIYNRGKTNLLFWGTKLGNGPKSISSEPRIISPTPDSFYYLLINELEKEIMEKFPPNFQTYVPFEIFIANEKSQKYIVKCLLYIVLVNGEVTIHTQNVGILKTAWSK
jgi:hypothetical protein